MYVFCIGPASYEIKWTIIKEININNVYLYLSHCNNAMRYITYYSQSLNNVTHNL